MHLLPFINRNLLRNSQRDLFEQRRDDVIRLIKNAVHDHFPNYGKRSFTEKSMVLFTHLDLNRLLDTVIDLVKKLVA